MAASDRAFIGANNAARATRLREEDAVKQEDRQKVLNERQDTLFNRSTTLFEQQQDFMKDELKQRKFGRDANTAIALLLSTQGQVYQPILSLWEQVPDGGKFHNFSRNDNGTFKFDLEWQGQRYRTDKATFDEVGKMAMSIANPTQYLNESGAAAAAEADFQRDMQVAQMKALKTNKDAATKLFGDKMTLEEYGKQRKVFTEEYFKLLQNNPDDENLNFPDASAEGGTRTIGMEEYVTGKFDALGFDISGARIDQGGVNASIPDFASASAAEIMKYAVSSGKVERGKETDFMIQMFIDEKRFAELDRMSKNKNVFDETQLKKVKLEVAAFNAKKATGSKEDKEAADRADRDQTLVQMGDGEGGSEGGGGKEQGTDIISKYNKDKKEKGITTEKISKGLSKLRELVTNIARAADRKRIAVIWTDVLEGKGGRLEAIALLESGIEKILEEYKKIRLDLPRELRAKGDAEFGITGGSPTGKGQIPGALERVIADGAKAAQGAS